ncbi:MAG: SMC family ATPase [Oscillospiraceae bacterium]|nr:SMC family ATPase [Oscillospiraceae bacterium]
MKPISVRFGCFGPYMDEQFVDFTQLEKNGLFLICGETGSGKTTILDAVCCALYGRSSGGLRGDLAVMRCKSAGQTDETFVELIFESGGEQYLFYRSIKPKKKRKAVDEEPKKTAVLSDYNCTHEAQILVDGVFRPMADFRDKASFLNDKAKELIGLDYDQFRQVIILPQGQFERLLISGSEEKEKILVTLFHAQRWQEAARKLCEQALKNANDLKNERLRIEEKLREYGCTSPEELAEKARLAGEEIEALRLELKQADFRREALKKQYTDAAAAAEVFLQLDELKRRYSDLLAKKDAAEQERKRLERADLAEGITESWREYDHAGKAKLQCENEIAAAAKRVSSARKQQERALLAQQEHEKGRESYDAQRREIPVLEDKRSVYRTLSEKKSASEEAERKLKRAVTEKEQAEAEFLSAHAAWEKAIVLQRTAEQKYQAAQDLYLRDIGSVLAARLEEGKACPVCGSLVHPAPAKAADDHITDAQLKMFRDAKKKADDAEEKAGDVRHKAESAKNSAAENWAALHIAADTALSVYKAAQENCIPSIATEAELDKEISRLTTAVEAFEKQERVLADNFTAAATELQVARSEAEKAERALRDAEETYLAQRRRWEEDRLAAGFVSDEEYRAACIAVNEKNARRTKLNTYDAGLNNAKQALDEKQQALEGKVRPDTEKIGEELKCAEKIHLEMTGRLSLQSSRQAEMAKAAGALANRLAENEAARVRADEFTVFAKRIRGDGGIGLQRYVLGVMLTSITAAANRLLQTVYGGRYQLYRTNEATGGSRIRGLELEVYDAASSERRSVTTLSGGEKFLVSLSLAIGLSAVVQAQGRGVRLGAMFIDEGFGSLDSNAVNDALEILQSVRRSAGLVGIISHVDRLAETIPSKIEVIKRDGGSSLKVIS